MWRPSHGTSVVGRRQPTRKQPAPQALPQLELVERHVRVRVALHEGEGDLVERLARMLERRVRIHLEVALVQREVLLKA